MTANPLLPPAGAEPGSVWLLVHLDGPVAARWEHGLWQIEHRYLRNPGDAPRLGYRLSDPHGAAAAVAVLEGWREKYEKHGSHWEWRRDVVDGFQVFINAYTEPFAAASTHPTSFLAAALAAVREWEGRETAGGQIAPTL